MGTSTQTEVDAGLVAPSEQGHVVRGTVDEEQMALHAATLSGYLADRQADGSLAFHVENAAGTTLANDTAINTDRSYAEKTLSISFTTGDDVGARQMIYEQGGGWRGINAFIEDGKLYMSVWNTREERWGAKELSAEIEAGASYTATLVMDGVKPADGSVAMYLDGELVGAEGGVGLLYGHSGKIGVGQVNGNTYIDGRTVRDELAFKGSVEEVVQLNDALSGADLQELHGALGVSAAVSATFLDDVAAAGTLAFYESDGDAAELDNSREINTDRSYSEKTLSIAFTAGEDVTGRQMLYEQGGGWRGINVFIENGKLFMAVWNTREENWGYKELSADIEAGQSMTATLVFDGVKPADGTISMYVDGALAGTADGVGLLYGHSGKIGIGETNGNTYIRGEAVSDTLPFSGDLGKILQLNEAADADRLEALQNFMTGGAEEGETPPAPEKTFLEQKIEEGTVAFYETDLGEEVLANDGAINTEGPYAEKTLSISFTLGADVDTPQMIYEQGGSTRGINVFVEDGKLFMAVWNTAEENWGYRELSADVFPDGSHTATLVFNGVLPADGTIEMYVDGELAGSADGVGLLYAHAGAIGVGHVADNTYIRDGEVTDRMAFGGTVSQILQLNEAVDPTELDAMHDFMGVVPPVIDANADTAVLFEDTSVVIDVLANDTDLAGDGLTVSELSQPEHGSASLNPDGTITYTADPDYFGEDSFTYTITGAGGETSTARVSLTVDSVNDAPVITSETSFTVAEDLRLGQTVGVVEAFDVEGDALTFELTGGNEEGLFAIDDQTGEIFLAGTLDYETSTSHQLEVAVSDGTAVTTQTVEVTVTDVDETVQPPEDKQNIVVILDSGDRSRSPDYLELVDSYDIYDEEPDAEGLHPHGKAVEKSVYDMVGGDGDTKVVHLKIANNSSSAGAFTSDIRDGFQYVIDNLIDAYDVVSVNLSYGGGVTNSLWSGFSSQFDDLLDNGTMVTISAGNDGSYGTNRLANAEQKNVLNVAATDLNGRHAGYSNEGDLTDYYAVGESFWHGDADNTSSISKMRGTSFSSPQVSGLVAKVQELAEDTFDRLLSVDEILETFDNVADTITGKFTGVERNFLNFDGVMKSFSDVFNVSVTIDETGDTKLLYNDGFYALENAEGAIIDITRGGEVLSDTMRTSWDAYQIEDNDDGGYTLIFRDQYGKSSYQKWDLTGAGEFISQTSLNASGVRAAEKIVGFDLNNDLMIETDGGQTSVFADRDGVQTLGGEDEAGAYLAASLGEQADIFDPAIILAEELFQPEIGDELFEAYVLPDQQQNMQLI